MRPKAQKKTIVSSFGAWSKEEHPELKAGTEAFVRKLRKSTRLSSPKKKSIPA